MQLLRKLPSKLVQRLRSYEAFQRARYEIAVAATFVRCGFAIEWVEEKAKKHCEFNATHKGTGETIAVETKSRHRPGTLNQEGETPSPEMLRADVQSLFNQRCNRILVIVHLRFLTFIYSRARKGMAAKEVGRRYSAVVEKISAPTNENPSAYTFLVFSNFAWQYEGTNTAAKTLVRFETQFTKVKQSAASTARVGVLNSICAVLIPESTTYADTPVPFAAKP
jgi:hypothetical protein